MKDIRAALLRTPRRQGVIRLRERLRRRESRKVRKGPADFDDMDQIGDHYTAPAGTLLVLLDDDRVVGTGAIRRIDEFTCELKRMWQGTAPFVNAQSPQASRL
jgi:hypothetical protein